MKLLSAISIVILQTNLSLALVELPLDYDAPSYIKRPKNDAELYEQYGVAKTEAWQCPDGTVHPYELAAWEECGDYAVRVK